MWNHVKSHFYCLEGDFQKMDFAIKCFHSDLSSSCGAKRQLGISLKMASCCKSRLHRMWAKPAMCDIRVAQQAICEHVRSRPEIDLQLLTLCGTTNIRLAWRLRLCSKVPFSSCAFVGKGKIACWRTQKIRLPSRRLIHTLPKDVCYLTTCLWLQALIGRDANMLTLLLTDGTAATSCTESSFLWKEAHKSRWWMCCNLFSTFLKSLTKYL